MKLGSVLAESTITHTCSKCGKTIRKREYSWVIFDEPIFQLMCAAHYFFKHHEHSFKRLGLIKTIFKLIILFVLNIPLIAIKMVCLPFYLIYEVI